MRPVVFLGTISYSIYMTHVFIAKRLFDAAIQVEKRWHVNPFTHGEVGGGSVDFLGTQLWHGDLAYLVYLALILAMSYFTYRWIEKPARDWVRNRVREKRQRAVSSDSIVSA
jgi:peptidoglycan/LPS O-acetylase OafA/YrhL